MTSPADLAATVLHFWTEELTPEQHWRKDPALDARIAERFGALRDHVLATSAAGWRDTPETLLAAILLTDQFSRNIHRSTARAFEGDALALELAHEALAKGWLERLPPGLRSWLLMPLMHSETLADQDRSVALFEQLGAGEGLDFARRHRDQIARFGRFPGRNQALGRDSTREEQALIDRGETF